jgi:hypothetical protein
MLTARRSMTPRDIAFNRNNQHIVNVTAATGNLSVGTGISAGFF